MNGPVQAPKGELPGDQPQAGQTNPNLTIRAVSATITAVVALFVTKFAGLAPPDSAGILFFGPACAVFGVIVGGAMVLWRRSARFNRIALFVAAAILTAIGAVALVLYIMDYSQRVTTLGDGRSVVVADRIGEKGAKILVMNQEKFHLASCEGVTLETRQISWPCAKDVTHDIGPAYVDKQLFDGVALDQSKASLTIRYYAMAIALILAVYLVIDEVGSTMRRRRRKRRK